MNFIFDYFSNFNFQQKQQLESHSDFTKIGIPASMYQKRHGLFLLHHVLHSLSIAKFLTFKPGSSVLDLGTGGGFPGVPLAIMFPVGTFPFGGQHWKKIKVINDVKEKLALDNITAYNERVENLNFKVDFVVCRAVAPLQTLINWSADKISAQQNHPVKNGFLCLKEAI